MKDPTLAIDPIVMMVAGDIVEEDGPSDVEFLNARLSTLLASEGVEPEDRSLVEMALLIEREALASPPLVELPAVEQTLEERIAWLRLWF